MADKNGNKTEKDAQVRESRKGDRIKLALVIAAVVIIVIGAAWQVCSRQGVKLFGGGTAVAEKEKTPGKNVKKTFEDYLLDKPYFAGDAEDKKYDTESELCSVQELSNNGIKISNVYYIIDKEGKIEQIRLRYGVADKESKVNLTVRGKVMLSDYDGNEILGIFNAVTDNFDGGRSQILNINLANGKYSAARGNTFVLNVNVDTTSLMAQYLISVPNEDGTFPEIRRFESEGIDRPYVMEDNAVAEEAYTAKECAVTAEYENGIKLSNVYYITDSTNGVEQLRLRYAAGEKGEEINLAMHGMVSVYAGTGEEMIGIFNTQTETFDEYATQIINIDFSESWYAGYAGKNIVIAINVDGTEYSARYAISVPALETVNN